MKASMTAPKAGTVLYRARGFSEARHRREIAATRRTYPRIPTTRIAPDLYARLQALCVREEGVARPTLRDVTWWVVVCGIEAAEKYNAWADKVRARRAARGAR